MTSAAYPTIGFMQMPAGFKYKDIFMRGRPRHEKYDSFYIKHPPMPSSRWAKIFAPFDALDGFDERINSKKAVYCDRKDLDEGEKADLNRKLTRLHSLTANGRLARMNAPCVSITYFFPCMDPENDWYGCGGQYRKLRGTVLKVEPHSIRIKSGDEEISIPFDHILGIDES